MKTQILKLLPIADFFLSLVLYPIALIFKIVRRIGTHRLPQSKRTMLTVGVFPIIDHYYEPQFKNLAPKSSYSTERPLNGINLNIATQLELVDSLNYSSELEKVATKRNRKHTFDYDNGTFISGDAEFWYQMIRLKKPNHIIEIGSGNSTLMAIEAIDTNSAEDSNYDCEHICIEPYEMPWLDETNVIVVRNRVEDMDVSFFSRLQANDILFIDSSHIIRPEGDVLFEFLEILPCLKKGVIVHIHDIFTPRNYLESWIKDEVKFWNEQYLLEAFLTHNDSWAVIAGLNYLHHNHYEKLNKVAPHLLPSREPGSFYIQRIK